MQIAIARKEESVERGSNAKEKNSRHHHEIRVNVEIFRLQIFSYC